jgi:hypothetical protein
VFTIKYVDDDRLGSYFETKKTTGLFLFLKKKYFIFVNMSGGYFIFKMILKPTAAAGGCRWLPTGLCCPGCSWLHTLRVCAGGGGASSPYSKWFGQQV